MLNALKTVLLCKYFVKLKLHNSISKNIYITGEDFR